MSLEEALAGKEIPPDIRERLSIVEVPFVSLGGEERKGHLVVHSDLASEIKAIFSILCDKQFPIQSVTPIAAYDWDDERSMAANNTSAFNYRFIQDTDRLSNHAYGRAIDINPLFNPYESDVLVVPSGATYDPQRPGTITSDIAAVFASRGWTWGGDWLRIKDWQHFEKK